VPLHERGKGNLGMVPRKGGEQLVVIQFGHSSSNVRRTRKGTGNFKQKKHFQNLAAPPLLRAALPRLNPLPLGEDLLGRVFGWLVGRRANLAMGITHSVPANTASSCARIFPGLVTSRT
jgi:hypothetical protein